MTILLTGGLGQTRLRLATLLTSQGHEVLVAAKTTSDAANMPPNVLFDWADSSTWTGVFDSATARASPITAVYIVVIGLEDGYDAAVAFVNLAREKGVKRFVFPSSSMIDEHGSSWHSRFHLFLKTAGAEWAVMRSSWFMQYFSEQQLVQPVKLEKRVVSAAGDGKIAFVDPEDNTAVAAEALTCQDSFDRDLWLLGPQRLSYTDVAQILTDLLGHEIKYTRLSHKEMEEYLLSKGLPSAHAIQLAELDASVANGTMEDHAESDVETVLKRPARTFQEYALAMRHVWE